MSRPSPPRCTPRAGKLIGELYFEKRYLVPFEDIPVIVR